MKKAYLVLIPFIINQIFAQSVIVKDGDAAPNTLLQINDEGDAGSITIPDATTVGAPLNKLYNESGTLKWSGTALAIGNLLWTPIGSDIYRNTGKVGIKIANPLVGLHIVGDTPLSDGILLENTNSSFAYANALWFRNSPSSGNHYASISLSGNSNPSLPRNIIFRHGGNPTTSPGSEIMVIRSDGNVGIGITNPTHLLHVYGSEESGAVGYFDNTYAGTTNQYGVYGACDNIDNYGYGGYFQGGDKGVQGIVTPDTHTANDFYGLYGAVDTEPGGSEGNGLNYGVYGTARDGDLNYGVYGYAYGGVGTTTNYGVYGKATGTGGTHYAGYFDGDVHTTGTLTKAAGSFKIDHPLDPANKYLSHSFVESPDMMNIYNGNVVLNGAGGAVVELPEYFNALNSDFRYQLTAIGSPGPNLYISQEINENSFSISGGKPGMKVSWLITGIRQDAYAKVNRIQVEEDKTGDDVGRYLNPETYGLSLSQSTKQ